MNRENSNRLPNSIIKDVLAFLNSDGVYERSGSCSIASSEASIKEMTCHQVVEDLKKRDL